MPAHTVRCRARAVCATCANLSAQRGASGSCSTYFRVERTRHPKKNAGSIIALGRFFQFANRTDGVLTAQEGGLVCVAKAADASETPYVNIGMSDDSSIYFRAINMPGVVRAYTTVLYGGPSPVAGPLFAEAPRHARIRRHLQIVGK